MPCSRGARYKYLQLFCFALHVYMQPLFLAPNHPGPLWNGTHSQIRSDSPPRYGDYESQIEMPTLPRYEETSSPTNKDHRSHNSSTPPYEDMSPPCIDYFSQTQRASLTQLEGAVTIQSQGANSVPLRGVHSTQPANSTQLEGAGSTGSQEGNSTQPRRVSVASQPSVATHQNG